MSLLMTTFDLAPSGRQPSTSRAEAIGSMSTEAMEAAFAALDRKRIPTSGHHKQGTLEDLRACLGDFGLALAYVALFSPDIRMEGGCPMGRFASENDELPLDRVHIDLLHHGAAADRDPAVFRALGEALAQFWSVRLMAAQIPGRFRYQEADGFDVVYEQSFQRADAPVAAP